MLLPETEAPTSSGWVNRDEYGEKGSAIIFLALQNSPKAGE
jgi:hypothetical protein